MSQVTIERLLAAPFVGNRTIVRTSKNTGIDAAIESNLLPKYSASHFETTLSSCMYAMKGRHNEAGQ